MASQNSIDLVWTLEKASDLLQFDAIAIVSQCSFFLGCVRGTQWEARLYWTGRGLQANLGRGRADDGPQNVEVEWDYAMLTADGEERGWRGRERKAFKRNGLSATMPATNRDEISGNGLLVQDCVRVIVRLWPVPSTLPRPLTLFARSSAGVRGSVTCVVERFSEWREGEKKFPVERMSKDEHSWEVVLSLSQEKLFVKSVNKNTYYSIQLIMLKEIRLVLSDGLTEVLWVGSRAISGNVFPFTAVQKLTENKATHLPHDALTVVLKFTDYRKFSECCAEEMTSEPLLEKRTLSLITPHLSSTAEDLPVHLSELLEQGTFSDFSLRVGTECISVHKCILSARSPVFKALLSAPMAEASSNEVPVPDIDVDTVRRLVRFFYTGSVPDLDPSESADLFAAADKYGVLSLRDRCSDVLLSTLSPQTVCRVLSLADRHSDPDLKRRALEYVVRNERLVFGSPQWAEFMRDDPLLALDIVHRLNTERLKC